MSLTNGRQNKLESFNRKGMGGLLETQARDSPKWLIEVETYASLTLTATYGCTTRTAVAGTTCARRQNASPTWSRLRTKFKTGD